MANTRDELKLIRELLKGKVQELRLRGAAEWLNEKLPEPFKRSHMSISNWLDGVYKPDDVVLIGMKTFYPKGDVRHDAAVAILALRQGKSVDWIELSPSEGKKLLATVKIVTDESGNVVHEQEEL